MINERLPYFFFISEKRSLFFFLSDSPLIPCGLPKASDGSLGKNQDCSDDSKHIVILRYACTCCQPDQPSVRRTSRICRVTNSGQNERNDLVNIYRNKYGSKIIVMQRIKLAMNQVKHAGSLPYYNFPSLLPRIPNQWLAGLWLRFAG